MKIEKSIDLGETYAFERDRRLKKLILKLKKDN